MLNRLIVLEEVGLVHEIVGRIVIILSRIDGHIEGEIVCGAVEAGSKVDCVQLGHAVPTGIGILAQFAVDTGIEVGGGIYDVGADLGGGIGVRLPCGDQHIGYVVGLSTEVVDCQRHVELASAHSLPASYSGRGRYRQRRVHPFRCRSSRLRREPR